MKLLLLLLVIFSSNSFSQTLYANYIPINSSQPYKATYTINSTNEKECILSGLPLRMYCSLSNITIPGKYTLVAKYYFNGSCNSEFCWDSGTSVSDPLLYTWIGIPTKYPPVNVKLINNILVADRIPKGNPYPKKVHYNINNMVWKECSINNRVPKCTLSSLKIGDKIVMRYTYIKECNNLSTCWNIGKIKSNTILY